MPRHKLIAQYEGDNTLFDELKEKGYVSQRYTYTGTAARKGMIYVATHKGEKFISISINSYTIKSFRRNGYNHTSVAREMFRLTDEGWSYLKGILLEENIGNHPSP